MLIRNLWPRATGSHQVPAYKTFTSNIINQSNYSMEAAATHKQQQQHTSISSRSSSSSSNSGQTALKQQRNNTEAAQKTANKQRSSSTQTEQTAQKQHTNNTQQAANKRRQQQQPSSSNRSSSQVVAATNSFLPTRCFCECLRRAYARIGLLLGTKQPTQSVPQFYAATMLSGRAGAGPNAVLAIILHHMCSFQGYHCREFLCRFTGRSACLQSVNMAKTTLFDGVPS